MPPAGPVLDDPAEILSTLIFRSHPDMVRARLGSRPAAGRPARVTAVDILISGGTLVDGTGAPGRPGSLAIRPIGCESSRPASRCPSTPGGGSTPPAGSSRPGFIDLHSHAGLMILAEPRHEPKVRQGVTTEVIGVDGNSYAPFDDAGRPGGLRRAQRRPRRPPRHRLRLGHRRGLPDPLRPQGQRQHRLSVGNSALRIAALGWDDVPADARAIDRMRAMLREGMAEGAFGLSSGLDYPPGAYATTAELAALTAEAGRHGGFYHTHVRYPLGDGYLDPFREAIEIGRLGGAPAHITHFYHRATFPGGPGRCSSWSIGPGPAGQDVTFDSYPSEWASTRLLILIPPWVQEGGPGTHEGAPRRSGRCATRIRRELGARGTLFAGSGGLAGVRVGYFARPEHARWEGWTLGRIQAETGTEAVDLVCDLLLSEDLRLNEVTPGPDRATMPPFFQHPVGMVGTDSVFVGDHPSPRTYGSFPRILGEFVRDERLLSLEEAVRKMTSAPAARLGISDRGRLADGLLADVVVFDPARVRSLATIDDPRRYPGGDRRGDRQRHARRRRRAAHGRDARPGASPRSAGRLAAGWPRSAGRLAA